MKSRLTLLSSLIALSATGALAEMNFNRISSFATLNNNGDRAGEESSAEIIGASGDGMTLIYTDSPLGVVGRIDITDPKNPKALGITDMQGEPTSVTVIEDLAYVAVNTSESYTNPSGKLVVVDMKSGATKATCDLGGQPDSSEHDEKGTFIAIAIENERDEDFGDGRVGQMPAGWVSKVMLENGMPLCASIQKIDVTGLAKIAPEDPEPEFVDVNKNDEIVVTMQENNHIVVIGADGKIASHFNAGTVDLVRIDTDDERAALTFDKEQKNRVREADGVQWLDDNHFMTANEGDMDGGSRSITVYHKNGDVVFESNSDFETAIIQAGHYPDKRSDAKGVEPEGMEFGVFAGTPYAFVLSERASTISVYDVSNPAKPVFKQVLPSGISPEGAIAIPGRNILATANEVDLVEDGGARAHVMIYEYQDAPASYPQLTSAGTDELIGWGANSGMVAGDNGLVHFVNDSFYGYQPTIFTVDTKVKPAQIVSALSVTRAGRPAQKLDMEGITLDGNGGYWIASEGRTDRVTPHAIYNVNSKGVIKAEIGLPTELMVNEIRYGFEGITKIDDTLWMAVQREWKDDPKGQVKLVAYNTDTKEWGAVRYPLDTPTKGWVGLSEIVAHGDYVYIIERDNQIGEAAVTKKIYRVSKEQMVPAQLGTELPVVTKELVRDLIPDMASNNGYIVDKVEGLAIFRDGTAWVSTDNDGVDDSSGETLFWSIGEIN